MGYKERGRESNEELTSAGLRMSMASTTMATAAAPVSDSNICFQGFIADQILPRGKKARHEKKTVETPQFQP
jgi:hypothetical protein